MSLLVHYITLPFHHYAQWVRDNAENAQSLERMTRTMSIFLTDPSHLIKIEGCYAICKLHSFVNQSIMSTSASAAYRRLMEEQRAEAEEAAEREEEENETERETQGGEMVSEGADASGRKRRQHARRHGDDHHHHRHRHRLGFMPLAEAAPFFSGVLTELECLLELMVRDYTKDQTRTWYVMIAIEVIKVACNTMGSYAQYLFVPFLWRSLWIQLKAALRRGLTYPARLLLRSPAAEQPSGGAAAAAAGAKTGNSLTGASVGPNKTSLVIPRVVDSSMNAATTAVAVAEEAKGESAKDKETAVAGWVPITGVDVLGVVSDLALLLRPLLLVLAAYAAFPKGDAGKTVALLPRARAPAPVRATTTADGKQLSAHERRELVAEAVEKVEVERENRLLAEALTTDKKRLLQSSWKVWLLFAVFDFLVLIIARFIRRRRVPVVYINDNNQTSTTTATNSSGDAEGNNNNNNNNSSNNYSRGAGGEVAATGDAEGGGDMNNSSNAAVSISNTMQGGVGAVPPLIARDALRIQQAVRNLSFSFLLRDPFFTVMIKPFFNRHLLNGFVSKIPLIGGLVHHQASYVLYMQHFSFLYSVGQ